MFLDLAKYLTVFLSSMFKFIFGPVSGIAIFDLSVVETVLFTTLGMMVSVFLFTYAGSAVRNWYKKRYPSKRKFSKSNRRFVKVWQRFGVPGISFLTPLIFTPIGGALLASAVGAPKKQVYFYMLISALTWSFFLSLGIRFIFPEEFVQSLVDSVSQYLE